MNIQQQLKYQTRVTDRKTSSRTILMSFLKRSDIRVGIVECFRRFSFQSVSFSFSSAKSGGLVLKVRCF